MLSSPRKFIIIFLFLLNIPFLSLAANSITDNILAASRLMYHKGQAREQMRVYASAKEAYISILEKTLPQIENKVISAGATVETLPFIIAAAYRLGIVTQRSFTGNVDKLYEQLESYKKTDNYLESLLATIANLRIEQNINISKKQYSHLYFSRAFNRVSWAAALINGNAWKHYFIYMPSDAVLMLEQSANDFEKAFQSYGIFDHSTTENINKGFSEFLKKTKLSNRELQVIIKVSFYEQKLDIAVKKMKKTFLLSKHFLTLYHSDKIENILSLSKKIKDIDEYVSDDNKPFFKAVDILQESLAQRSF